LTYRWDKADRLTGVRSSNTDGLDVAYAYDAANRLTSVSDTRFGTQQYAYDAVGRRTESLSPNGVKSLLTYNDMDRVERMQTGRAAADSGLGTVYQDFNYTYTPTGQLESIASLGGGLASYEYDAGDRLTKETLVPGSNDHFAGGSVSYSYDAAGNMLGRTSSLPGVTSESWTYDATNQRSSESYDDHGDLSNGTDYNFLHQSLNNAAKNLEYIVNGDGVRVGRRVWNAAAGSWETSRYLVDDMSLTGYSQVLEEVQDGQVDRVFAYGDELMAQDATVLATEGGGNFTVALGKDGKVYAWGSNSDGQLGDLSLSSQSTVTEIPGLENIIEVTAGSTFAAALDQDGMVWVWGALSYDATPVQLDGIDDVVQIAAGADHLLMLSGEGEIFSFGANQYGQLGDGTYTASMEHPVQVSGVSSAVSIDAGARHSIALLESGDVLAWGDNRSGQLGDPGFTENGSALAAPVSLNDSDIQSIDVGADHTLALNAQGQLYSWGGGSQGQLGLGDFDDHAQPTVISIPAAEEGTDAQVVSFSAGSWHSFAQRSDGVVFSWGNNDYGQLGPDSSDTEEASPVEQGSLSFLSSIHAGDRHNVGQDATGSAFRWGAHRQGQLGVQGTVKAATPQSLEGDYLSVVSSISSSPHVRPTLERDYFHQDVLGNVRMRTDIDGGVRDHLAYSSYGQLLNSGASGMDYRPQPLYHGERYDPLSGQYHMRARDYDPTSGRFQQIDRFDGFMGNPLSLNRYTFAENNPVGKYDPSGRYAVTLVGAVYMLHSASQFTEHMTSLASDEYLDPQQLMQNLALVSTTGVAVLPPVHKEERQLWVHGSDGGMIGSLIGKSSREVDPTAMRMRSRGVANDLFFSLRRSAAGRQSWATRQVENAWGAIYNLRRELNTVIPLEDGSEPLKLSLNTRWPDNIYHDSLLQSLFQSRSGSSGMSVTASFNRNLRGRMRAEARPDLTGLALRHLNAANGGGVIDWQTRLPSGSPDAYNSALSGGANNFAPDRQQLWDEMQGVIWKSVFVPGLNQLYSQGLLSGLHDDAQSLRGLAQYDQKIVGWQIRMFMREMTANGLDMVSCMATPRTYVEGGKEALHRSSSIAGGNWSDLSVTGKIRYVAALGGEITQVNGLVEAFSEYSVTGELQTTEERWMKGISGITGVAGTIAGGLGFVEKTMLTRSAKVAKYERRVAMESRSGTAPRKTREQIAWENEFTGNHWDQLDTANKTANRARNGLETRGVKPGVGERSLNREQYKVLMSMYRNNGSSLQKALNGIIESQDYVYRATSRRALKYARKAGRIDLPSYMTTESLLGMSSRSIMDRFQIFKHWRTPDVILRIPKSALDYVAVPRPLGGALQIGWEPFTDFYPAAGSGGGRQFLGTTSTWDESWVIPIK